MSSLGVQQTSHERSRLPDNFGVSVCVFHSPWVSGDIVWLSLGIHLVSFLCWQICFLFALPRHDQLGGGSFSSCVLVTYLSCCYTFISCSVLESQKKPLIERSCLIQGVVVTVMERILNVYDHGFERSGWCADIKITTIVINNQNYNKMKIKWS